MMECRTTRLTRWSSRFDNSEEAGEEAEAEEDDPHDEVPLDEEDPLDDDPQDEEDPQDDEDPHDEDTTITIETVDITTIVDHVLE